MAKRRKGIRKRIKPRVKLHPDAPRELKCEYRKLGSVSKVAKFHRVNPSYVFDLLKFGKIPGNREIATKLHVDFHTRAKLQIGDRQRRHVRWWEHLSSDQRNQLIHFMFFYKANECQKEKGD